MDLTLAIAAAADAAAKALDKEIPDGMKQQFIAGFLEKLGEAIAQTGRQLGGAENKDGDA